VSGPTVYAITSRSLLRRHLGPFLCRRHGCRWETRTGYDWCPRCGHSSWHIAQRRATLTSP